MSATFKLRLRLGEATDTIVAAAEAGVRDGCEHLLTEANKSCPNDEGTLERSGRVTVRGTQGAVSYDTPYAVRQHEDMSLRHDGKGRSKWLETTMGIEAQTVAQIIVTRIRNAVR